MRKLSLMAGCFALAMAACSGSDDEPAGQAGGAGSSGTAGSAGMAGSAGTAGGAGAGGAAGAAGTGGGGGSAGSKCPPTPSYDPDCSKVSYFECGFGSTCEGDTLKVSWHEHYFCDGQEQILPFSCTYKCADGCNADYHGWPQSGSQLVSEACGPSDGGTAGSAGAPGDGGTCNEPSFDSDCSKVTSFQCGFSASCEGSTAKVSWHHHYDCNGQEQIKSFTCTYECASGCDSTYMDWPKDGETFVAGICKGADGGGS